MTTPTRDPQPSFNGRKDYSYAELFEPAMKIETQEEADAYLDALITYQMENGGSPNREDAAAKMRESLGYFAGYHDHQTRRRVERLFRCEHPYFGSIEENGPPTPEEALALGKAMGAGHSEAFKAGFAMGKRMANHKRTP
jgi:hypothetical protein